MKIFFIGSIPDHKPGENRDLGDVDYELFEAAFQLGRYVASREHTLMIGSDSQNTMDYHLFKGICDYCSENSSKRAYVEVYRPEVERPLFAKKEPGFNIPDNVETSSFFLKAIDKAKERWKITHFVMLLKSDVIITMGGGSSTEMIGMLASEAFDTLRKPVVAIKAFGGKSERIFDAWVTYYKNSIKDQSLISSLQHNIQDFQKDVISLAELLHKSAKVKPHDYFLSYSWHNEDAADQIELFLTREQRTVHRDDRRVKAGHDLDKRIKNLIAQSETFLALWSENFESSDWCPGELDFALEQNKKTGNPKRIILIKLDQTSPPLALRKNLYKEGNDRQKRKSAIIDIVRSESEFDF